jgi:DNA primase large subunit
MLVLKGIDKAQAKGVKSKDMRECMQKLLQQYMPEPSTAEEVAEARATDNASHYILRLAYSRTAALRKWFVEKEEVLFRHRFNSAGREARSASMGGVQAIGEEGFESIAADLQAVFCWRDVGPDAHLPDHDKEKVLYFKDTPEQWTHICKVPFEQVADLVRYRRVFLQGGWAYVLSSDTASVAATAFRERLQHGLAVCCENLHTNVCDDEAERLAPLLFGLPLFDQCAVFGPDTALALKDLPAAMTASAPLCMRRAVGVLKDQHHLKHGGRWQLGMFLKGIGVRMDDALALWADEFRKGGTTAEQFDKEYSYNIKHQYGQAGSRNDYRSQSCRKVIGAGPDSTCATGCPFKTCGSNELKRMLQQMHVPPAVVTQAVGDAEKQNYQVACSQVYKGLHGKELVDNVVTHPNQYFQESRKQHEEMKEHRK